MAYLDQAQRRTENMLKALQVDKSIALSNRNLVKRYIDFMGARGLSGRTVNKNVYCLMVYLKALGKTDALKASRTQIEAAMARIENSKYSLKSKQNIKITVKSFYKHFLGEDLYYPKQVAWIKSKSGGYKKMLPEDILSEDEVLKMLKSAKNFRDKAIISLLFDSGIRVGELLAMRVKDVEISKDTSHITVTGKTGMRRIPLMFSVPYLAQYLNEIADRKGTDYIWPAIGSWTNTSQRIDYNGIRLMLKNTGKRAKIEKRVYPHLFRHSRASYYANKLTEQQLKAFFGWAGDSRMAATYVHLSGRDIDKAVQMANGITTVQESARPKLTVKACPKCQNINGIDATYCSRCGSSLEIGTAVKDDEQEALLKEKGRESLQDQRNIEELIDAYFREKERKGKRK